MSIEKIFKEQKLEQDIKKVIEKTKEQPGRMNDLMNVKLVGCNETERTASFEFPISEWQMNPQDMLHGGITATMMDLALGLFANCICLKLGGFFSPTVNMSINYLQPVYLNDKVTITAQLVSTGRSLLTLSGEAKITERNCMAATASATYKVIRK
ncbi:PaaI family thioesterase [Aminipila luticellarii]|uniref:PaaI family thioesterase n=1 Tax=Aminipila luticellarii TaxID=2507160 RepID=A0A410PVL6_9FIRM|nr:PaaI family thioesterase [Aminipila luticellarii]QAT42958.1 PaaI family thioesterase [Aminipila luticellarii]